MFRPAFVPRVVAALIVVAPVLFAACSQTDATAPLEIRPIAPDIPPAAPSWDGLWSSMTAEGLPLAFKVAGNTIRDVSISIRLTGDCNIDLLNATVPGDAGSVHDNLIVVGDSTTVIELRGSFQDFATASGQATANYYGPVVDGVACHSTGTTVWNAANNQ